jgi:prepilin-type N-terminal cleavage/methylation domain-containing protein
MNRQAGFTLTELLAVIFGIGVLSLAGLAAWALVHFLMKFW